MKGKTRIFIKMRKKKTYKRKKYGSGIKVRRPYINKRNRLMLGEGKKTKKQRGGFFAPIPAASAGPAIEIVSSLLGKKNDA